MILCCWLFFWYLKKVFFIYLIYVFESFFFLILFDGNVFFGGCGFLEDDKELGFFLFVVFVCKKSKYEMMLIMIMNIFLKVFLLFYVVVW